MRYAAIQSLLDAHLAQVTGLPPLQLENTRNVGKTGQAFSRATLVTNESQAASNQMTRYGGLYVVDLYYPIDTGVADANAMADAVIGHFESAPLHRLIDGALVVQLERAWREGVGRREQFYALQVKVRWHSLL